MRSTELHLRSVLFTLSSPTILAEPNVLHLAKVFIRFVRMPPLVIQINATYIYNSLQCDLLELHL
jgi:hypothetical protein